MRARTLKIESTGDFFAGKVRPKIRITGRWLEAAGFRPGHHVQVNILEPGRISLQFVDATPEQDCPKT